MCHVAGSVKWLYSDNFTYEQAQEIFITKNYKDSAMRGRQSLNPLKKMGFVYLDMGKKIAVTPLGESFLAENYDIGEVFLKSFLKWQYPNPDLNKYSAEEGYNVKPLIATFHVIKKVNNLCIEKGIKEKGVSKIEFAGGKSPPSLQRCALPLPLSAGVPPPQRPRICGC